LWIAPGKTRLFSPAAGPVSEVFDAWLRETVTGEPSARDRRPLDYNGTILGIRLSGRHFA